jgi:hypothetical protein
MPGGRPKYKPTEADRNTVRSMAATGFTQEQIATCLGTAGIDPKTMREHFAVELDTAANKANAAVANRAYQMAVAGNPPAATFFWLKCRAGWKDSAGPGSDGAGKTVQLVVVPSGQPAPGGETASSPAITVQVQAAGKSRLPLTLAARLNQCFEGYRLVAFQDSGGIMDDSAGGTQRVFITVPVMPWVGGLVGGTAADSRRKSGTEAEKPAKPEPGGRNGSDSNATG